MKDDWLGLNHLLSCAATVHTVRPASSARSSGHLRMAPPQSSSDRPRCCRYQSANALPSPLLLKNTPPMPVTLAIDVLLSAYRSPSPIASNTCRDSSACISRRTPA